MRHVAGPGRPDVRSDGLTVEENEQACNLALDLLAEWLAEQGYVAE